MFIHYRTQGFIFKKENRGEADQLFSVFTKDFGRLEISGKAVRKIKSKLRSGAEIFYLSEIEFIQGKAYKTLTDAVLINKFKNIRDNVGKLKIAFQISETLDNLVKTEESDEGVWELLQETFSRLNSRSLPTARCLLLYYYFLWNLFSILGYQPQLYNCTLCQKKVTLPLLYFSFKEGGVVCKDCFKKFNEGEKISPEVVKILRLISNKDWKTISRLKIENIYLTLLGEISKGYYSSLLEEEK